MSKAYFVTGTDTGVGKTHISSALIHQFAQKGLKAVGMKPVASGFEYINGQLVNEDVSRLMAASNLTASLRDINPYAFEPPIAPHLAAQQAGVAISVDSIKQAFFRLSSSSDVVIVEGAGGFYVPLDDQTTMVDLVVALNIPVVLVVGIRLGCINHALLSVAAIQSAGLQLAGWVANQVDPDMPMFDENIQSLKQRISAPCLGVVPWQPIADLMSVSLIDCLQ